MKSQLSQLQKKQTLLRIFIFTLVTVMVWVGLTLFRTQQETGIRPALIQKSEALNPNISAETIDLLEQKKSFTESELSDFPVYSILTTKNGEQQLVVFSASDKSKRPATITPTSAPTTDPAAQAPLTTQPSGTTTPNGGTVTVQPASQSAPPADTINPGGAPAGAP